MSINQLFDLSSTFAIPFWFLLIGLGWLRPIERILRSPWIAIAPALIYAIVLVPNFNIVWNTVTNGSLTAIADLLSTPEGATLAWAHFLAFDLLIGRWIYLDSREQRIPHLLIMPVLFLTLMIGPVGYLLYLLTRSIIKLIRRDDWSTLILDKAPEPISET
ncbi:MAG: ABA4-like family protein [Chloroflexota bacterium]